MRYIQRIRRKLSDFFYDRISPSDNLGKAYYLMRSGQSEEAGRIFQNCISKDPGNPKAYEALAHMESKTFNRSAAAEWLSLSIKNTKALTSFVRYITLLMRHGQFEEGEVLRKEMLHLYGKKEHVVLSAAESLFFPKQYEEIDRLILSLEQPSSAAQLIRARALVGAKQNKEADNLIEQLGKKDEVFTKLQKELFQLLTTWQKHYRRGANFDEPKIFGIGLSRTGTTSLSAALNTLGFSTIHFTNPITKQIIDIDDFLYYDAFCDSPVSYRFEELYEKFPNARFIYTERKLRDWIRSSSDLYKGVGFSTTKELRTWLDKKESGKFGKSYHNNDPVYREAYGSLYADFEEWESAYHAFDQRVNHFFIDKPQEKFLKINICDEPSWKPLCTFLKLPLPDKPFPYSNTVVTKNTPYGA